jgi:hypothetical protein
MHSNLRQPAAQSELVGQLGIDWDSLLAIEQRYLADGVAPSSVFALRPALVWGDGIVTSHNWADRLYPVYADYNEVGQVAAIHVVFIEDA